MHTASGFKPLLSLQFIAKPMLEQAVGLDSIASGTAKFWELIAGKIMQSLTGGQN
jgi:hypothetical protein